MSRPALHADTSSRDFEAFYWLKSELVTFCRRYGLPATGSKLELAARITTFLQTGSPAAPAVPRPAPTSAFDWAGAVLTPATLLTDNYRSTENVRRFFTTQLGGRFRFTVPFMRWLQHHPGRPLAEAVAEYRRQQEAHRATPLAIAPQFEYNRYLRAFLAGNPGQTPQDARRCWQWKRGQRGPTHYEPAV